MWHCYGLFTISHILGEYVLYLAIPEAFECWDSPNKRASARVHTIAHTYVRTRTHTHTSFLLLLLSFHEERCRPSSLWAMLEGWRYVDGRNAHGCGGPVC